jgi:5-hydroxyisourate hydrolase
MTGRLTTHVLNTAQGSPAGNMAIELWSLPTATERRLIKCIHTNADGRTDEPLLVGGALQVGVYELIFAVGDYFAHTQANLGKPPFLDQVPIRFGIADPTLHYHIPLLVSPWSYSTYRGS